MVLANIDVLVKSLKISILSFLSPSVSLFRIKSKLNESSVIYEDFLRINQYRFSNNLKFSVLKWRF